MKYVVKIQETLVRHFIVEANTKSDAEERLQEHYDNGWVELDYDDFTGAYIECERVATKQDFEFYNELEE